MCVSIEQAVSGGLLLCGEDIANKDLLDVGGLDAGALDSSCSC
jgi:hypothetical protein